MNEPVVHHTGIGYYMAEVSKRLGHLDIGAPERPSKETVVGFQHRPVAFDPERLMIQREEPIRKPRKVLAKNEGLTNAFTAARLELEAKESLIRRLGPIVPLVRRVYRLSERFPRIGRSFVAVYQLGRRGFRRWR